MCVQVLVESTNVQFVNGYTSFGLFKYDRRNRYRSLYIFVYEEKFLIVNNTY
jgi:hypothetical protein